MLINMTDAVAIPGKVSSAWVQEVKEVHETGKQEILKGTTVQGDPLSHGRHCGTHSSMHYNVKGASVRNILVGEERQ